MQTFSISGTQRYRNHPGCWRPRAKEAGLAPERSLPDGRRSPRHCYPTIDDALGPAATRFFGDGHRKVGHQLRGLTLETTAEGLCRIRGKGDVAYPRDWSAKTGHAELRPHLSSIDAVVLAVQITERGLAHALGLDSEQRRRMWVRAITVRAGTAPQLDLDDLDVSATLIRSQPVPLSLCGHVSTAESRIGPIKVILEVEHEPGRPGSPRAQAPGGTLPDEPAAGYYGDAYKKAIRGIREIHADAETGKIEALVSITQPAPEQPLAGTGAAYHPCLTPIDAIVTTAQLAQVLTYATDHLRRDQTSTLWMRHFSLALKTPHQLALKTPHQPISNPFITSLHTAKSRTITHSAQTWRTVDMAGAMLGVTGSFSVTHLVQAPPA